MKKIIILLSLLAALTSCTSVVDEIDDPFLRTGSVTGDWPSLATTVRPEYAVAALPGLSPTTVRQTSGKGGVEQTILYANSTDLAGENMLAVTIKKSGLPRAGRGAPSRSQVEAEMRSALSGVRMRISPVIADNAYGVFGYATGVAGKSGNCVYAWQFARSMTHGSRIGGLGNTADIRMRYCSLAMTADSIVALMHGLRLNPVMPQNPETLRFAAVPGAFAPAAFATAEPFVERNPEPAAQTVDVVPERRAIRRVATENAMHAPEKTEQSVVSAVKVPMPGEAAALIAAQAAAANVEQQASGAVGKRSFGPAPATVAVAAQ